jgi:hypothetical protein
MTVQRKTSRIVAFALVAALASAQGVAAASATQATKALTARYHSYGQAAGAGYSAAGEPCVESPAGAMGVHAVNPWLAGDLTIDPLRPEILLYLPDRDGELQLVGVEYFEVALANTESGPAPWFGAGPPPGGFFNPAPSVFGHTFDGPMAGHNPNMPWHYDLHVWLFAKNPAGMFTMFNPALACPAG